MTKQVRERVGESQHGVDGLGVLEVDERLVDHDLDLVAHLRGEPVDLVGRHVLAGRVVRVADHDEARPAGDRCEQRLHVAVGHRHRPPTSARGHQRVERIARPGGEQLVAGREERQGCGLQQLRRAVAEHDPLRLDLVALRQCAAHALGVAVGVTVESSAGGVDRGVDHLGVGELGPLRPGQVEVRDLLEGERLLAPPPRPEDLVRPPRGRCPRTACSSRGGPRSGAWRQARSRALDDQEPEREQHERDTDADGEDPLDRAALLVVAGRAADELPGIVDALGERRP